MTDNSTNNRRIIKNTVYLYIRLFFAMGIGLYTSRVILEALGVDDFGLYSLVGGFVSMMTILTGAFSGTASRFIMYEIGVGDVEKLKRTISTIVNLLIIIAIAAFVIGYFLGSYFIGEYLNIPPNLMNVAYFVFYCALFTFSMNLLAVPYQALIVAHERISFYAIMSILETIAKLAVALSLYYFASTERLYYYASLLVLISILSRVAYGIYCNVNFKESKHRFVLDKTISKQMTSFSIWMGIGTASGILKDQGLNIIINVFYNLTVNAARGISLQVMSVFNVFASNIGLAISPQITKSYSQGNISRSINLTFTSAKAQGYLILIMMIPFLLESHYLLTLWLKSFPEYTQQFVCWGVLICFINALNTSFSPIYLAMGRIRNLQIIGSFVAIMYLPICYYLCSIGMDIIICMQLGLGLEIILFMTTCLYLKKTMDFPVLSFLKKVTLPMLLTGLVTLGIVYCVRFIIEDESFVRLLLSSIFSLVSSSILIYFIGLSDSEKALVKDIVIKKLKLYK